MRTFFLSSSFVAVLLAVAPGQAASEDFDAQATIKDMAATVNVLGHIDTIYRLTEELVFWQSVAIMGGEYGWVLGYNTQGTANEAWTIRLDNALGESEIEVVNTARALKRQRGLGEDLQRAVAQLYEKHVEMWEISKEIHQLLFDEDDVGAAQDLFRTRSMQLRRDIANDAHSIPAGLRDDVAKAALGARLAAAK